MTKALLSDLDARGLIAQTSDRDRLEAHLDGGSRSVYAGFDPSADSLHIGNLVPLLALRRFQLAGHRPVALVGGATGLIGDPSFKASERALNDPDVVAGWAQRIRGQLTRLLDPDGPTGVVLVDNLDWVRSLSVIEFLRDVGKHFSVNAMIQKESVRARLDRDGSGISYTEFSYMILQAYDYAELARRHDVSLQIGGSDQWGNITSGMDLARRLGHPDTHALTLPLVTKADGTKFGKTESGAVWLDPARTSPYAFHQFWVNAADADVIRFLRLFTFLGVGDIADLESATGAHPERREAQRVLAAEVTRLVHGAEGCASAERIAHAMFRGDPIDLAPADLEQLAQDGMPVLVGTGEDAGIVDVLVAGGLADSRGAARRLIEGGGVRVNGTVLEGIESRIRRDTALHGRFHLVRRGRRNWLLVHWAA